MNSELLSERLLGPLLFCLLGMLIAGCDQSARGLPLDEKGARAACETFLKAWQEGKEPSAMKPEITGSDYQWSSGHKLVAYEILPDETNDGTNLHLTVRLKLKDAAGKESQADAIYTVGTSPVITVFRK